MKEIDWKKLKHDLETSKPVEIIPTGFEWLDERLGGGLHAGSLLLVQAPSGQGKTSFLLSLAMNWIRAKESVLYISAGEQTAMEIYRRLTAMARGENYFEMVRDPDCDRHVSEWLEGTWPYVNVEYTEDALESKDGGKTNYIENMMVYARMSEIRRVCYDYIGSTPSPSEDSEWAVLTRLAGELKNLADANGMVVATAMQTNRGMLKELRDFKPDKTPYMNEDFTSKAIGVAQKATCCLTRFSAGGRMYVDMFKNRQTGKLGRLEVLSDRKTLTVERAPDEKGFGQDWMIL